jgi:hypothetical protein
MTTKRSAHTPMPTTRATRSKTNLIIQLDDASTGFSTGSAAPFVAPEGCLLLHPVFYCTWRKGDS